MLRGNQFIHLCLCGYPIHPFESACWLRAAAAQIRLHLRDCGCILNVREDYGEQSKEGGSEARANVLSYFRWE